MCSKEKDHCLGSRYWGSWSKEEGLRGPSSGEIHIATCRRTTWRCLTLSKHWYQYRSCLEFCAYRQGSNKVTPAHRQQATAIKNSLSQLSWRAHQEELAPPQDAQSVRGPGVLTGTLPLSQPAPICRFGLRPAQTVKGSALLTVMPPYSSACCLTSCTHLPP